MVEFISNSPQDTENFAFSIADKLNGGTVLAFTGSLGMGKTCFVRGLARGIGYKGDVTSPTFSLVNEYIGGRVNLYHFDMYRVTGWEDLYSTGYFDYLDQGGLLAVEWSENISAALDDNTVYVTIEKLSDFSRRIKVYGGGF
ncbi:MAG: tRNA (adenosine(37)-N6)-threonylcarbamoyltransferase complex ATPase subunit type 1 TsaE [Clostridia bacterium]|nr:tRNA (adenosine(37)-N6)-threonylcarbamoyltransferase complex ATPase subunit type 1 TsaE [Clostridia bacterium]